MAAARAKRKSRPRKARAPRRVTALVVDSNYDAVSQAAFGYRQQDVYPYLEQRGMTLIRCQGQMARRKYVAQEAARTEVRYITGTGHGSYDSYTGDHYDPIFTVGSYERQEVEGKIVHLLSCQTAAQLGPDMVRHGCLAFFGYDENFVFATRFADIFFQCDGEIDRAFAERRSAGQVYRRVYKLFSQKIQELEAEGHDYTAMVLEYDRDHLCAPPVDRRWGDPEASLGAQAK